MSRQEPSYEQTKKHRSRRRWGIVAATLVLGLIAPLGAIAGPAAADETVPYSSEPEHPNALVGIVGPNNAGAQDFAVADGDSTVTNIAVWLRVTAAAEAKGSITADIRTKVDDPSTSLASSTVDIAGDLGGAGVGWVNFPFTTTLSPGQRYSLVLQATVASGVAVAWFGTKTPAAGSYYLPGWNYDVSYYGGWHQNATWPLAFYVNPAGDEACGNPIDCYKSIPSSATVAKMAGLYDNGETTAAISVPEGWGSTYVDGSNVLQLPDGRWRYLPDGATSPVTVTANDPDALAQIAESRAWLASGTIPGNTDEQRRVAARALLSMRALTQPNGAVAAAWNGIWEYSWPRDSAFVAAAFSATGHTDEAYAILQFDASTQRADGTWDARTTLDGSGPPDGRQWQLDANGWVPWAVWQWYQKAPSDTRDAQLAALYPVLKNASDYVAASLDPATGLPPASPDYWEVATSTPNIGTAAPLLAGLNASADLARRTGNSEDQRTWANAAKALSAGIAKEFAPTGYPRTADNLHGRDSAVAFMAPPFNTAPADLPDALASTWEALVQPQGGVLPGNGGSFSTAWTPSTTFFALAWAGVDDTSRATTTLNWVLDHRNWLDELPEQVDKDGNAYSVVPLAWTDSLALMTMAALDGNALATPPFATEPAVSSTTTLTASATSQEFQTDKPAHLTATVKLKNGDEPKGTVTFRSGATKLGEASVQSNGTAVVAIPADTPVGHLEVTATFVPKDSALQAGSTSSKVSFTVAPPSVVALPIVMTIDGKAPGRVNADATLAVRVTGLQPGSTASLSVHSAAQQLGTGMADADGVVRVNVVIPASVGVGSHVLVLHAKNSLGASVDPSWNISVRGAGANGQSAGENTLASTGSAIDGAAAAALCLLVLGMGGMLWVRYRKRTTA